MSPQSPSADTLLKAALAAHQAGKLDDASALYRRVIAANPRADVAHHNLGLVDFARGDLEAAEAAIRRALDINPDDAGYHSNLAMILRGRGDAAGAVVAGRAALALAPRLAAAHNNLALALMDLEQFDEAEAEFGESLQIEPRYADAQFNLTLLLLRRERFEDAEKSAIAAIRLRPNAAKTYVAFGDALAGLGRSAGAVEAYRRALTFAPSDVSPLLKLADALDKTGDAEGALERYRQAYELAPSDITVLHPLADALQQQGELPAATKTLRDILALHPGDPGAHAALARTLRFSGREDPDFRALDSAYGGTVPDSEGRGRLAFGMGKALEDMGEYEAAFGYLLEGNRIRRSMSQYDEDKETGRFNAIRRTYTRDFIEGHRGKGHPSAAPIFILGMPRSGTTLTEQLISNHHDVFGAGELSFMSVASSFVFGFSTLGAAQELLTPDRILDFHKVGETYLDWLTPAARKKPRFTDKMPHNFRQVGLIRLVFPNARIVHVRRSPMDTCLSNFKNSFGAEGLDYSYDLGELGRHYNLYRGLMAHWREVLPGEFIEVRYEDLVTNPEETTRALFEALDLSWSPEVLDFHRSKRQIKTASFAQVRRPIYKDSVNLAARYGDRLQPLIDALAEWRGED